VLGSNEKYSSNNTDGYLLPRPPPSGFPMDQSSGNIYVYADCKNLPQEVINQAP
jgi:hypothetical protein